MTAIVERSTAPAPQNNEINSLLLEIRNLYSEGLLTEGEIAATQLLLPPEIQILPSLNGSEKAQEAPAVPMPTIRNGHHLTEVDSETGDIEIINAAPTTTNAFKNEGEEITLSPSQALREHIQILKQDSTPNRKPGQFVFTEDQKRHGEKSQDLQDHSLFDGPPEALIDAEDPSESKPVDELENIEPDPEDEKDDTTNSESTQEIYPKPLTLTTRQKELDDLFRDPKNAKGITNAQIMESLGTSQGNTSDLLKRYKDALERAGQTIDNISQRGRGNVAVYVVRYQSAPSLAQSSSRIDRHSSDEDEFDIPVPEETDADEVIKKYAPSTPTGESRAVIVDSWAQRQKEVESAEAELLALELDDESQENHDFINTISQKEATLPNGLKLTLPPANMPIFLAMQAGYSKREIADRLFPNMLYSEASHRIDMAYASIIYEVGLKGYNLNTKTDKDKRQTTYELKIKERITQVDEDLLKRAKEFSQRPTVGSKLGIEHEARFDPKEPEKATITLKKGEDMISSAKVTNNVAALIQIYLSSRIAPTITNVRIMYEGKGKTGFEAALDGANQLLSSGLGIFIYQHNNHPTHPGLLNIGKFSPNRTILPKFDKPKEAAHDQAPNFPVFSEPAIKVSEQRQRRSAANDRDLMDDRYHADDPRVPLRLIEQASPSDSAFLKRFIGSESTNLALLHAGDLERINQINEELLRDEGLEVVIVPTPDGKTAKGGYLRKIY